MATSKLASQVVRFVKLWNDEKYHTKSEVFAAAQKKHIFGKDVDVTKEAFDDMLLLARRLGADMRKFHRPIKYTQEQLAVFATAYNASSSPKACKLALAMNDKEFLSHLVACRNHNVKLKNFRLTKAEREEIKQAIVA
jgi:hypothetical protein